MEREEIDIKAITEENERRKAALTRDYDPVTGVGCYGERVRVKSRVDNRLNMVPRSMVSDRDYKRSKSASEWVKLRCRHDFEYWAVTCVVIKDKTTGRDIPFRLNAPQRRVLAMMEDDRRSDRPIRLIMLKARQWGGSTLIQMYMAWIQTVLTTNWHSLICAHVKDTSATIRGMYSKMLRNYPRDYWQGEGNGGEFKPFEGSRNIRLISGRGCKVTLGSSENQDAVRGSDYAMAHLSEVAFWKKSDQSSPEQFIRAVCGSINSNKLTLIALESTANGVGNYFHREWLRSVAGESDKRAVFVPWHEIEIYRREVKSVARLWRSMDEYERGLWESGLTLEMIGWFHHKRKEYSTLKMMQAEYPTTSVEAFTTVDRNVFAPDDCERMRQRVMRPEAIGELEGLAPTGDEALKSLRFVAHEKGRLKVWRFPEEESEANRYVVAVDVGGRSAASDWSVIAVIDRFGGEDESTPEVVAQWRGHIDHDLLAWNSVRIAQWYGEAHLVIESNTLESESTDGDPSLFILNEIRRHYVNLYRRPTEEGMGSRVGFHTNRSTKTMIINRLIATVRDGGMIERDNDAVDELLTYQLNFNGSYGAMSGCHDDILMTRAIALHAAAKLPKARRDEDLERYLRWFR